MHGGIALIITSEIRVRKILDLLGLFSLFSTFDTTIEVKNIVDGLVEIAKRDE